MKPTDRPALGFPGPGPASPWKDLAWLLLGFGLLWGSLLGLAPLANPDEGRYAEIPREMLDSGDWVLPRLNEVAYYEKPPLVYWLTAAVYGVLGVSAFSARLVPLGFALLGVGLTYLAGRALRGRLAGLASACVLGTSLLYTALARIVLLDMAVSVLMAGALLAFVLGVRQPAGWTRRLLFWGLYLGAALATLAKGLIGFLLPGAILFLWLLVFKQWRRLRPFYPFSGSLLFFALALPWHLLAQARDPGWAGFYLYREHFLRFTTPLHDRYEPWYYFVPILALGLLPWTGFALSALLDSAREVWANRKNSTDTWFLLLWTGFVFVFFSRSQSKLAPYILPVFPPLALLLGFWVERVLRRGEFERLKRGFWFACVCFGLLGLVALGLALAPDLAGKYALSVREARASVVLFLVLCVLVVFVAVRFFLRSLPVRALGVLTLGAGLIFASAFQVYTCFPPRSTADLAELFRQRHRVGERVYHYRCFAQDFLFYTRVPVGTVEQADELGLSLDPVARSSGRFIDEASFLGQWEGSERVWALARNTEAEKLFAREGFVCHVVARNHRYCLFSNQP